MASSVPHMLPGSLLLDWAVGGRVSVIRRQKEVQAAIWCSQETKKSCHVAEKLVFARYMEAFLPKDLA